MSVPKIQDGFYLSFNLSSVMRNFSYEVMIQQLIKMQQFQCTFNSGYK